MIDELRKKNLILAQLLKEHEGAKANLARLERLVAMTRKDIENMIKTK